MRRLAGILAAVGTLAFCAPASAGTFYADQPGDGTAPCPQSNPCDLPDALTAANASGDVSDVVQVEGPLTFTGTGTLFIGTGVALNGSGKDAGGTRIDGNSGDIPISMADGATARNLAVSSEDQRTVAMDAGGVLEDAVLEQSGDGNASVLGMATDLADNTRVTRASRVTITSTDPDGIGVRASVGVGRAVLEDADVSSAHTALSTGDLASSGGTPTVIVRRSTLLGEERGILAGDGATPKLSSSVIAPLTPSTQDFEGIRVNGPPALSIDGSTLYGAGPGTAAHRNEALEFTANRGTIAVRGSVIRNFAVPINSCDPSGTPPATATFHASNVEGTIPPECDDPVATIDADPGFLNPAAGNFGLRADSPGIDTGNAAAPDADASPTDRGGGARATDGDGDGDLERDMGAFEFQPVAPVARASAAPASVRTGAAVRFDGSASTDSSPGDTLTYSWRFDDGLQASGAVVSRPFYTPGPHTGTLTVTDRSGRSAQAVARVTVTTPPRGTTPPVSPPVGPPIGPVFTGGLGGKSRFKLRSALRRGIGPFTVTPARADWTVRAALYRGRTVVGRATKSGDQPGKTSFRVKFNRKAKRSLRRKRSVRLTLRVIVSSAGGEIGTLPARRITLRR